MENYPEKVICTKPLEGKQSQNTWEPGWADTFDGMFREEFGDDQTDAGLRCRDQFQRSSGLLRRNQSLFSSLCPCIPSLNTPRNNGFGGFSHALEPI